ncbi:MAG TPA: hypothetical protein VF271_05230 [Rhodanobacteraceae bacterium]
MNAADQRRLTPWLAGACIVLAVVWIAFVAGIGRGIHWLAPGTPPALPTAHAVAGDPPLPLSHYAAIWEHPLFTSTREPAPEAATGGGDVSVDNLELTGVMLAPGLHMALLRNAKTGHGVRVREGARLAHSNWTLQKLDARSAVFVDGARRTRLALKTPGKASGNTADAPAPTPAPASTPNARPSRASEQQAAAAAAQRARTAAIKQRIEQRRRQQAAHAGEH